MKSYSQLNIFELPKAGVPNPGRVALRMEASRLSRAVAKVIPSKSTFVDRMGSDRFKNLNRFFNLPSKFEFFFK